MSPTRRDILKAAGVVSATLTLPAACKAIEPAAAAPEAIEASLTAHSLCFGVVIDGVNYSLIDMCGAGPRIYSNSLGLYKGSRIELAVSDPAQQLIKVAGESLARMMRIELEELAEQGGAQ